MGETLWGFDDGPQFFVSCKRDLAADYYVSVKDIQGQAVGGVGVCLRKTKRGRKGLLFRAPSLVLALDDVVAYFRNAK